MKLSHDPLGGRGHPKGQEALRTPHLTPRALPEREGREREREAGMTHRERERGER